MAKDKIKQLRRQTPPERKYLQSIYLTEKKSVSEKSNNKKLQ